MGTEASEKPCTKEDVDRPCNPSDVADVPCKTKVVHAPCKSKAEASKLVVPAALQRGRLTTIEGVTQVPVRRRGQPSCTDKPQATASLPSRCVSAPARMPSPPKASRRVASPVVGRQKVEAPVSQS